ncbi:MAG: hypothetical protein WKG07_36230 [Hymenobacter sp.]
MSTGWPSLPARCCNSAATSPGWPSAWRPCKPRSALTTCVGSASLHRGPLPTAAALPPPFTVMLDQVRQFISQENLFDLAADTVLVAVSGGLDSVVLLDVLHRLGAQAGGGARPLRPARRGGRRRRAVRAQAGQAVRGALFRRVFPDQGLCRARGHLDPNGGRGCCATAGLSRCARRMTTPPSPPATTAATQAETMLLNLTHGTGLAGLHGIRAKNGQVVRPLLAQGKRRPARLPGRKPPALARGCQQRQPRVPAQPACASEVLPVLREHQPQPRQHAGRHRRARGRGRGNRAPLRGRHRRPGPPRRARGGLFRHSAAAKHGRDRPGAARAAAALRLLVGRDARKSWPAFKGLSGKQFDSPTHRLVKDRDQLVITPRRLAQYGTLPAS